MIGIFAPKLKKNIIVLSESGMPIDNAHIVTSDSIGTITDQNGRATVQTSFALNTVTISHVGYKSQNVIFAQLPSEVYLESSVESLDEVVIIAQKPQPTTIVPQSQSPAPAQKAGTPWYVWAGLAISAVGLIATLQTAKSKKEENIGLSKPKKPLSRKRKKPVKKRAKKRTTTKRITRKKAVPVTI